MSRRKKTVRRPVLPDARYDSQTVSKFINSLMYEGKKAVAERIFYGAMDLVESRTSQPGVNVFKQALTNLKPVVEVKSRRVGGATYQVPVEVRPDRRTALAMRWLILYSRERNEKSMAEKLDDKGGFKVERVVCAVDCGTAINPDQVRAQMEGGIGFGLGSVLHEELTLTKGAVDQANYDAYLPLRIEEMPTVETYIVPSEAVPSGVGEPGVPPIGPAVANALAGATGKHVRILPFAKGLAA